MVSCWWFARFYAGAIFLLLCAAAPAQAAPLHSLDFGNLGGIGVRENAYFRYGYNLTYTHNNLYIHDDFSRSAAFYLEAKRGFIVELVAMHYDMRDRSLLLPPGMSSWERSMALWNRHSGEFPAAGGALIKIGETLFPSDAAPFTRIGETTTPDNRFIEIGMTRAGRLSEIWNVLIPPGAPWPSEDTLFAEGGVFCNEWCGSADIYEIALRVFDAATGDEIDLTGERFVFLTSHGMMDHLGLPRNLIPVPAPPAGALSLAAVAALCAWRRRRKSGDRCVTTGAPSGQDRRQATA